MDTSSAETGADTPGDSPERSSLEPNSELSRITAELQLKDNRLNLPGDDGTIESASANQANSAEEIGLESADRTRSRLSAWVDGISIPVAITAGICTAIGTPIIAWAAVAALHSRPVLPVIQPRSKFTIPGTLTIKQPGSGSGFITKTPAGCQGAGSYSDLSAGTAVIITNPEGRQIAVGGLRAGKIADGSKNTCVMTFSIPRVPRGFTLYSITISHRGTEVYTAEEVQAGVSLEIGP